MKRILFLAILLGSALAGCQKTGRNGELTGIFPRPKWDQPVPFGMLTIPPGTFHMGQNNQDVNFSQIGHNRQITISAFYIDETEITNNEYRQFVQFTQGVGPNEKKVEPVSIDSIRNFLKYHYKMDWSEDEFKLNVYPDTLVWLHDFSYTYNEPLVENYFWHPAFDQYPVVGINWFAAQAFCNWRTQLYNNYRAKVKKPPLPRFRLPTEAEWEYAARGGYEHKIYPWLGYYVRNSRGCYLGNFKPGRGDYISDNFEYTAPAKSYWPNDYGLYAMAGNVAEWVEDDFEEAGYTYAHDINPVYRDRYSRNPRRVIRGGSWKDVAYFLSVGTRTYEYADTTKSFVGFRCVVSILGRSGAANL